MPHITIDYSANLEAEVTGANLASALHQAALASKVFPTSGIRIFARRVDALLRRQRRPRERVYPDHCAYLTRP